MSEREALRECSFVPVNEPWTCSVHGGIRTRLDEPQCDRVKPAEPFNDAYLDNLRQSIAEGHYPQGLYNIRRLLATIDALRAALAEAAPPSRRRIIMLAPVGADGLCTGCGAKPTRETGRCKCVTGPLTTVHPAEAAPPSDPREGREYSAVVHGIPRLDALPEAAPPSRALDVAAALLAETDIWFKGGDYTMNDRQRFDAAREALRSALAPELAERERRCIECGEPWPCPATVYGFDKKTPHRLSPTAEPADPRG